MGVDMELLEHVHYGISFPILFSEPPREVVPIPGAPGSPVSSRRVSHTKVLQLQ